MTDLMYPCGCKFEMWVFRNDEKSSISPVINSWYEIYVEDDGNSHELCDFHRKQLEQDYDMRWPRK